MSCRRMIQLSLILYRIAVKGRLVLGASSQFSSSTSFVGTSLRPRQVRPPPPPPRASILTSVSATAGASNPSGEFNNQRNKDFENSSDSPKDDRMYNHEAKFPESKPKPPKARIFMGRELPPPVMEYDNHHYDDEFGSVKPGEYGYVEFHDGILEELEAREAGKDLQVETIISDVVNQQEKNDQQNNGGNIGLIDNNDVTGDNDKNSKNNAYAMETGSKRQWAPKAKLPPRPTGSTSVSTTMISTLKSSTNGTGELDREDIIQQQLNHLESEIFKLNDGNKFNINSPKQVSMVLYGVENESTTKVALEALAGNISNTGGKAQLASLILKYRKYARDLKRIVKNHEYKENGTLVANTESMREGKKKVPEVKVNPSSLVLPVESTESGKREPLVLIDASAYIFRAYFSMPAIHRFDGEPTGATLGFCNMLNKLVLTPMLKGEQPRIALVFDSKEGANFRKELYPEYKSNRPDCPEDLIPQFDFVRDAAVAYGILQLEAPGYEADDVIATLSTMAMREGCHVNILSGDKDLMQLVTKDDGGACIEMIDPMKMVRYCYDTVKEKWGVEPYQIGDVLALAGDSSDNIPGVPGIGPKIAASLIHDFGSLETLLENLDNVPQKGRREKLKMNVEMAKLSRKLVELERNVPLDIMSFPKHFDGVSDFRMEPFDQDRLLEFYDRMGFRDIKNRVRSRLPKTESSLSSFHQRYSSISDISSSKKSSQQSGGSSSGNGFSRKSDFVDPPKPEDFHDVPF